MFRFSLAWEFSRWKECQTEFSLGDNLSDNDIRLSKEDSTDDTAMDSLSPSILSDFSSVDQCLEGIEARFENPSGINCLNGVKSPLQVHIDQKFDSCFPKDRFSSESDSCEENSDLVNRTKVCGDFFVVAAA